MSGVATLKLRGAKRHFDEMAIDLPVVAQACSPGRMALRTPPLKRGRTTCQQMSSPNTHARVGKPPTYQPTVSSTPISHQSTVASNPPPNAQGSAIATGSAHAHVHAVGSSGVSRAAIASVIDSTLKSNQNHLAAHARPVTSNAVANRDASAPGVNLGANANANANDTKCLLTSEELDGMARHLPRRLRKVVDRLASGEVTNGERLFTMMDLREIVASVMAEHEAKLTDKFTISLHERLAEQFRDFTKFNEDYVARQLRGTDVAYLS